MNEKRTFEGWLDEIDQAVMEEINQMPDLKAWYDFFNNGTEPLNPREFLQFWSLLAPEEQWTYMLFTPEELFRRKQ